MAFDFGGVTVRKNPHMTPGCWAVVRGSELEDYGRWDQRKPVLLVGQTLVVGPLFFTRILVDKTIIEEPMLA